MKNQQLIFVDDSGDPGFKLGKGSSRFFVIAAILFEDELDAEEASLVLRRFKKELGWAKKREFKHNKTSDELRSKFFSAIRLLNFNVSIIVLDKARINIPQASSSASMFYNNTILSAIKPFFGRLTNAKIYVDGESGNNYRRNVKTYLRKNIQKGKINNLIYRDSNAEILIQLADMIAGTARKAAEGDIKAKRTLAKIKKKTI